MKNAKRILSLIIVLTMCFSLLPTSAFAEEGWNNSWDRGGSLGDQLAACATAQLLKKGADLGAPTNLINPKTGWCAWFVYACAREVGIDVNVIPEKTFASQLFDAIINAGGTEIEASAAVPGDIIMWGTAHIGIVTKDKCIAGNTGPSSATGTYEETYIVRRLGPGDFLDSNKKPQRARYVHPNYPTELVGYALERPQITNASESSVSYNSAVLNARVEFPENCQTVDWGLDIGPTTNTLTNISFVDGFNNQQPALDHCVAYTDGNYSYNVRVDLAKDAKNINLMSNMTFYYWFWVQYIDESGKSQFAHSEIKSFTTKTQPQISVSLSDSTPTVTDSTARLRHNIYVTGIDINDLKKQGNGVGVEIYDSTGQTILKSKADLSTASSSINVESGGYVDAFYTVGSGQEVNLALSPGATYQYCFFVKYSGEFYRSGFKEFTIDAGNSTPTTSPSAPSAPSVSVSGQSVTISWNDVANETGYDVYLVQSPWRWEDIKYSGTVGANTTCYTFTSVAYGDYKAFVISRPNSDTVQSGWTAVTVTLVQAPDSPTISTDKSVYALGDTFTVSWTAATRASNYFIQIYKDGTLYYEDWPTVLTYSRTASATGSYTAYITAQNAGGSSERTSCTFTVLEKPETPTVSVGNSAITGNNSTYLAGESIVISWTQAARNENYWINVFKDDILIVNQSMGTARSYTLSSVQAGTYRVYVSANNAAGQSGLTSCTFDVTLYAVWAKPDFALPALLTIIESEAFVGGAFTYVKLPDQVVSIGWHAFADCPNLAYIYIPALTTQIDEEAFGTMQGLTILGKTGTTAETYAQNHHFTFIAVP